MPLTVENLCYSYGKHNVLQDISFTLPSGTFLALLGPNGTGKTTLLKAIGMLSPPKSGKCIWNGQDLVKMGPVQRAKQVAYLPQSTHVPFPMKALDLVLLGRSPYTSFAPKRADREEAVRALEILGLEDLAFRDVSRLSGGERQQILLARALVQKPQLLLLDEPTSSLDLKNQLRTMRMVQKLCREEGLTAITAIHDLNLATMFCNHFLMLQNSVLFAYGGEEVLTPENIQAVYSVPVHIYNMDNRNFVMPVL